MAAFILIEGTTSYSMGIDVCRSSLMDELNALQRLAFFLDFLHYLAINTIATLIDTADHIRIVASQPHSRYLNVLCQSQTFSAGYRLHNFRFFETLESLRVKC